MSDKEKMIAILKYVVQSKERHLSYKENGEDDMEVVISMRKNYTDDNVDMIEVKLPWHDTIVGCYKSDEDLNHLWIGIEFSYMKTTKRIYRWFFYRNLDRMLEQCGIKVE